MLFRSDGALARPLLYLSLYFKTHRDAYYELLQRVRTHGAWEAWLEFFLQAVIDTTERATDAAQQILNLFSTDRARIEKLGRPAASMQRVHQLLQEGAITSIKGAATKLGLTTPTIIAALKHLEQLGVVRERTGRRRNRLFVYDQYLKILAEGTEPLR